MPELPEVEVIRRGLEPHILGIKISKVWHSGKKLRKEVDVKSLKQLLINTSFSNIDRRAKYLLLHTATKSVVVIHLGMTGRLGLFTTKTPRAKHDHLIITFTDKQELRFNDTRRFGFVQGIAHPKSQELEKSLFKKYGPEPFSSEFTAEHLIKCAANKKQAVKNFLMDNKHVVGVGNIYANETLFAVGIHPATPAEKLNRIQWQAIHKKLIETLLWAIDCGGSTISDFLNASGQSGYFQANFKVYSKQGEPCPACKTPIDRMKIGGRASFFCPCCQKKR